MVIVAAPSLWSQTSVGRELERSGRYEQAATAYLNALQSDGTSAAAWIGLERVLTRLGRLQDITTLLDSVIGLHPANNFLRQEPGTNAQIKDFCSTTYGVEFELFAKVSVKGRDKCELFGFLTSKQSNPEFGGELKWNFTKFLVDREGRVIGRFEPRVKPRDPKVVQAIEAAL